MGEFNGKVALVTGGTKGIGRATVLELCNEGAHTVIASRNAAEGARFIEELTSRGLEASYVQADVGSLADIKKMVQEVLHHKGKIDILVNCAGVNIRKPIEDYHEDDWNYMVDINMKGTFFTCQEVGKSMIARGIKGAIVNVGSIQNEEVLPERGIYAGTKGAVKQMTKAFAIEWVKHGIRANSIAPAFISTPLVEKVLDDPQWKQLIISRTPMGRAGKPEEVAHLIVFLCSEKASYITGTNMMIDGGWTAG
ncbi:MAG: SDR family NAD(P)-dependent oxidoreductase [Peptococcaceae bacterium]